MGKQLFRRIRELYEPFFDAEAAIIFGGITVLLGFAAIIMSGIVGSDVLDMVALVFFGLGGSAAIFGAAMVLGTQGNVKSNEK